jgi:hypothetical protein
MLPEELRPAPGEDVIPKAGTVPLGATMGEESQELPMNPARSGHCTWE